MTRLRAELKTGNPTPMMKQYYEMRAGGPGLIITEAISISQSSSKNVQAPGLYADRHVPFWREITDIIHAKGSKVFAQLAHYGRIVHPDIAEGRQPLCSTASVVKG